MSRSQPTPEQLLNRIEWTVMRKLDGLFQGDYQSLFRGSGLDLADLREYQPSDDVRYIDWNVTARLQTPYVREYHEDRELTAWFLVDLSPSVEASWSTTRKRTTVIEFTVLLTRLLSRRGNRVGAIIFDGSHAQQLPPSASRDHVLYILHVLMRRRPVTNAPPTDLPQIFRNASRTITRRSLVFIVSDFVSRGGWEDGLGELARRHEVLGVRVLDPSDRELPDLGIVTVRDAESGEQLVVDTHSASFRRAYRDASREQEARIRQGFAQAGVDALELLSTDDLFETVLRFANLRKARRSAGVPG